MKFHTLRREQWVPYPVAAVFDFFSRAENLEQLTPPFLRFKIITPHPIHMEKGAHIQYALRLRGIPLRWLTEIEQWDPPHGFVDTQIKGPYRLWHHTHTFSLVEGGTNIVDVVQYALPFGLLGRIVHRLQVAGDVARIFDYRQQQIKVLFP
jgi:ligand-binding SRPBCC domain-containing protein